MKTKIAVIATMLILLVSVVLIWKLICGSRSVESGRPINVLESPNGKSTLLLMADSNDTNGAGWVFVCDLPSYMVKHKIRTRNIGSVEVFSWTQDAIMITYSPYPVGAEKTTKLHLGI